MASFRNRYLASSVLLKKFSSVTMIGMPIDLSFCDKNLFLSDMTILLEWALHETQVKLSSNPCHNL